LLNAGAVVEGAVEHHSELIAGGKDVICDQTRLPDGVADRVAVPVVIRYHYVAKVVEFLGRVVLMDIGCHTVHRAAEIVTAVLDAPEPASVISLPVLSSWGR
jgi:hypothetical protein